MNRQNPQWSQRPLYLVSKYLFFLCSAVVILTGTNAHAAMLAARVTVTGTDNATTVGTVTQQTPGATLFVATDPANFGDLTLREGAATLGGGGTALKQADGVIIAAPNQFQWVAVGDRNMIETPGEFTSSTGGFSEHGMFLSTTKVSSSGLEANFNVALAYFRFSDNWIAGHVLPDGTGFHAGNTSRVTVTPQFVGTFGSGHYTLSISDVDSRKHGMLFAMSEENSSSGNVVPVGILPDGSGWDIRINDQGLNFPATESADWSFVYVPYKSRNLIAAGEMEIVSSDIGVSGVVTHNPVGTFTVERVDLGTNGSITPPGTPDTIADAGRFLIKIPGKDDTTGYLMVGVADYASNDGGITNGADDNMLTWEYRSELGGFLVESYDLTGAGLQNSNTYFAYFDYANPLEIPEPATIALSLLAGLGLFGWSRRRA